MTDYVLYLQLHLWNWIVVSHLFSHFVLFIIAKGAISIQPSPACNTADRMHFSLLFFYWYRYPVDFLIFMTFISSTKHNRNVMLNIYDINQFCKWFTFMHLVDAFIQSDLHYIQAIRMCVPWELNPQPFALLTQCSTTKPQEHIFTYTYVY